jgi:sec-independent protein translocase protein TatB
MFDISWSHLLIFALAAIVLVPSKDLPALLRTIGRYVGDARKMARDFRSQVEDALRETELAEVKKSVEAEMRGLKDSASLSDAERSFNDAMSGAKAAPAASPFAPATPATGSIIPSVATSLPVTEPAAAPAAPASAVEPAASAIKAQSGLMNGSGSGAKAANDGIEVVRAGRGSVAQRAAAAWKKTAGSEG